MTRKTAFPDDATLHSSEGLTLPFPGVPDEGKLDGADDAGRAVAAWGLELGQTAAHLVRLECGPAGLRVQSRQKFAAGDLWRSGSLDARLLHALNQIPPDEPLGVCFPDHAMLCRGFSLPRADPAATAKMVDAQVESLLSIGPERLVSTWHASADPLNPKMQWVLFCAVQRTLLEQVRAALPAGVALRALLPRALAVAHGCLPAAPPSSSQLLIELTDDAATMTLLAEGRLLRCLVMDGEQNEKSPSDGAPAWIWQSRQSCQSLLEGLPRQRWPQQGMLRATNGKATELLAPLGEAVGVNLSPWPSSTPDVTTDDVAEPAWGAVAAARMLLADSAAIDINFARPHQTTHRPPTAIRPRRLLALGLACLVGVVLLYGIDCYRGWWLARQVEQVRAVEAASGGLERRLALDKYLQKNASPVLPGLDAILAAAPPSLSMTNLSLTASGQFRFVGAVGSPGELDEFLRKLQGSKALANVEMRSARNDQQRWLVEVSADAAPAAGLLLVAAPKPVAVAPGSPPPVPLTRAPQAAGAPASSTAPATPARAAPATLPATTAPATQPLQGGGK